ncbi:MAG: DUF6402 family protein [Betaproteobacteria bacterium]|nr:DUF6402 family protein [Betaproteobacteria bacterium]
MFGFGGPLKPEKVSYYQITSGIFGKKWKYFYSSEGAMPLITSQTVQYTQPEPEPPQPKLTREQLKAKQKEEELAAWRAERKAEEQAKQEKQAREEAKKAAKEKGEKYEEKRPEGEEVKNLPIFKLEYIPGAMKNEGWPISAKFAQKWLDGSAFIINDSNKNNVGLPMDEDTVTLKWARRFGNVDDRYEELLAKSVFNEFALNELKPKIIKRVKDIFFSIEVPNTNLRLPASVKGFSTESDIINIQQFHKDWHFQHIKISTRDTFKSKTVPTDLTGSLGSFALYAAVGRVFVSGRDYFIYDDKNNTKTWCLEPNVQMTHVYVYLRDIYEFNGFQYLGHWNKTGLVSVSSILYTPACAVKHAIDTRRGGSKFQEECVYWPVFNNDFNVWREINKSGGDFMIFSKPVLVELPKPIEIPMEKLCLPPVKK